jgi:hypothetical protein
MKNITASPSSDFVTVLKAHVSCFRLRQASSAAVEPHREPRFCLSKDCPESVLVREMARYNDTKRPSTESKHVSIFLSGASSQKETQLTVLLDRRGANVCATASAKPLFTVLQPKSRGGCVGPRN